MSLPAAEKSEKNSISIPGILADFFLKKIEMDSYSDDSSGHKHKGRRRKSKHRREKEKYKKSRHRHRSRSSSREQEYRRKDKDDDVSSSEEISIKRLKKIKNLKLNSKINPLLQCATSKSGPEERSEKSSPSNSSTGENLVFYGPSLELLLSGVEPTSSNAKLDSVSGVGSVKPSENTSVVCDLDKAEKCDVNNEPSVCSEANSKASSYVSENITNASFTAKEELKNMRKIAENVVEQEKDGNNCVSVCDKNEEKSVNVCEKNHKDSVGVSKKSIKNSESVGEKGIKVSASVCATGVKDSVNPCEINEDISNVCTKNDKNVPVKNDDDSANACKKIDKQSVNASEKNDTVNVSVKKSDENASSSNKNEKDTKSVQEKKSTVNGKIDEKSKSSTINKDDKVEKTKRNEDKKKSRSRSRSRSKSRNVRNTSLKSKNKRKSRSSSRSSSRGSPSRSKRRRSPSTDKSKSHSQRKRSRSRSRSRPKYSKYKRSRSRSPRRRYRRSRSRSRSRQRRYSRSRSRRRSRSRQRDRSLSRSRRWSKSEKKSKSRSRSRSKSISRKTSKTNETPHSRSRSKSKERSKKLDQARILETAKRNVLKMMKDGTLPEGLNVENLKKEQAVSIQTGGKSVQELTDFCTRLSQKENDPDEKADSKDDDASDNDTGFIHHPFKVKEPGMIKLNIKNAVQLPIKTHSQKIAELSSQFPVSSGNQHKQKELEWIPVVPDSPKTEVKPADKKAAVVQSNVTTTVAVIEKPIPPTPVPPPMPVSYPCPTTEVSTVVTSVPPLMPPPMPPSIFVPSMQTSVPALPPPPPPEIHYTMPNNPPMMMPVGSKRTLMPTPSSSVFKPHRKIDISSIVTKRFQALTKLQHHPNDPESLAVLRNAQQDIQDWVESQQVPGMFTGSTDAKMLSVAQLCGPKYYSKFRKDIFTSAPPLSDGKGMSLLKKMGWNPGEGLGKNKEGSLEPLVLDIKMDKKGLVSEGENSRKGMINSFTKELQGKHPVSALMELCSKRKWKPPLYTCIMDTGPPHKKQYCFKVEVNGVEYQPANPCANKKVAKADSAVICLQTLNVFPKTPT